MKKAVKAVNFYSSDIDFNLLNESDLNSWILQCFEDEKKN